MAKWDTDKVIDIAFGFNAQPITKARMLVKKSFLEKYDYYRLKQFDKVED